MIEGWGTADPPARVIEHGPWSLQVVGERIENIRFDGVRVLRSIRCVVRDRDWRTFDMAGARIERCEQGQDGLHLVVTARAELGEAMVDCTIEIDLAGHELRAVIRAETLTTVVRNRLGLIVLHPLEESGTTMRVAHPDGTTSSARFGPRIAPHQPAHDIAGLTWERAGLRSELRLSGDVFETEDQRNWTDASFKTYSTPLALPFPVTVPAGTVIEHGLHLSVHRTTSEAGAPRGRPTAIGSPPLEFRVGSTGHALPALAVGATTAPGAAVPRPAALRPLAHLVEVPVGAHEAEAILYRAIAEAAGADLDIRLIASDAAGVRDIARLALQSTSARVVRMGVVDALEHITTTTLWEALATAVADEGDANPHLELVGGTHAHFTELNRRHAELPSSIGSLAFSLTPQMHDHSIAQLLDSLDVLPMVLDDARNIAAGRPLHIGPITLRPRFNAVATSGARPPADIDERGYGAHLDPDATDPRWRSPAAGPWLLAALERLARPGVASIAVGEARGPRGVDAEDGLTAAGEVLAWFAARASGELLPTIAIGALPTGLSLVALRTEAGTDVLLGSLRDDPVTVSLVSADDPELRTTVDVPPWSLVTSTLA